MTRGDGAWHNYYRSRITPPAGARRSLRSRGANLSEYSLPRELISVVIIISPTWRHRPGIFQITAERKFRAQMFARASMTGMMVRQGVCSLSAVFKTYTVFTGNQSSQPIVIVYLRGSIQVVVVTLSNGNIRTLTREYILLSACN